MEITLVRATRKQRPVLERLLQLYQYDFSEILEHDAAADATYSFVSADDYWDGKDHHALLVEVDGKLAGFALVRRGSALTGDGDVMDMDEFFVMRKYRRRGVGREVARRCFEMFPGRWEVAEVAPNAVAQAFWRKVIGEYTGGSYEERLIDDERWRGPVQTFVSQASA
jgi:predicted acetyltransferase